MNKIDLISRETAKNYIDTQKGRPFIGCTIGEAMKIMIDEVPSAEPERKTGKWLKTGRKIYKCSECGNFLDFNGVNAGRGDANFCPNCGTKMLRGEK